MALRVSEDEVREIITPDSDITDLIPFISAANTLVSEELVGKGLSEHRLKEIERWLTAHFISIQDRHAGRVQFEQVGETRASYPKLGEGLKHSSYGMQVLVLDTSGTFAALGKTKARFRVI